jgi:PhoH-like ATPase
MESGVKMATNVKAKKYFVIDTNVLIDDPKSVTKFDDNVVILPIVTLEEIDSFKKGNDDKSRNARHLTRMLDKLKDSSKLSTGVKINAKKGILLVQTLNQEIHDLLERITVGTTENIKDNLIIATALYYKELGHQTILVTKDFNMRVRAKALEIETKDYIDSEKIKIEDIYTGVKSIEIVDHEMIEKLRQGGLDKPFESKGVKLFPNQFVIINAETPSSFIAKVGADKRSLRTIKQKKGEEVGAFGIKAKSVRQRFAFDLLMDDDIKLVCLLGSAGTGKTLLSIAAGLEKVIEQKQYTNLFIARPMIAMGGKKNEIGFLPGGVEDKVTKWMEPIYDNLDYIFSIKKNNTKDYARQMYGSDDKFSAAKTIKPYEYLRDIGVVKIDALTFIRGRSIPNQFIIIDEAQNLDRHEVKTIISRAGEGTKIILTGDPDQIDNPYLDSSTCGLTYVVEKLKNEAISGSILLDKCERSELANIAAKLL